MIGKTLAHYDITEKLGQGGMGEVFRARDSKLDRDVAIKVLPTAMSRDPERVLRFQREARALAALNHVNIGAIYGFEEVGDVRFLVLELIEGDTLADRLKAGPLPVDETLAKSSPGKAITSLQLLTGPSVTVCGPKPATTFRGATPRGHRNTATAHRYGSRWQDRRTRTCQKGED